MSYSSGDPQGYLRPLQVLQHSLGQHGHRCPSHEQSSADQSKEQAEPKAKSNEQGGGRGKAGGKGGGKAKAKATAEVRKTQPSKQSDLPHSQRYGLACSGGTLRKTPFVTEHPDPPPNRVYEDGQFVTAVRHWVRGGPHHTLGVLDIPEVNPWFLAEETRHVEIRSRYAPGENLVHLLPVAARAAAVRCPSAKTGQASASPDAQGQAEAGPGTSNLPQKGANTEVQGSGSARQTDSPVSRRLLLPFLAEPRRFPIPTQSRRGCCCIGSWS